MDLLIKAKNGHVKLTSKFFHWYQPPDRVRGAGTELQWRKPCQCGGFECDRQAALGLWAELRLTTKNLIGSC